MNETQRNIKALKAALPELREKVAAVALLLLMSAAMMTSATFAWITLSRAPEVSNVSTTVAANGNLEIALVKPDGSEPAESAVGDSSATLGQSVVNANLTWGNLVNLSDESYGLNNIVLRPALLGDPNDLLSKPLKGVDYSADGRLQQYYNEDYQFANWTIPEGGSGYFMYNDPPRYGVRAISSIKYEFKNNTYFGYTQIRNRATGIRDSVVSGYSSVTNNKAYINSLAGLMGDFMTDQLNDSDTNVSKYIGDLYHMLDDVYKLMTYSDDQTKCFEDALAELANAQVYLYYKGKDEYKDHTYTKDTLMAATNAQLSANGVSLPSLTQYKTLKNKVKALLYGTNPDADDCLYDYYRVVYPNLIEGTDIVDEDYNSGKTVLRSAIMPYINNMVDIASTKIIFDGKTRTVAQLTASKSEALGVLGKDVDGVITKGYLKDFEQLTGGRLDAKNVEVSAHYLMTVRINAKTIRTAAAEPYEFDKDVATADAAAAADKGDYTGIAQDTYGMAVDFWVRTNATDSYLILEGNVLTETETVRATGLDKNGNTAELSTVTVTWTYTDENDQEQTTSEDVTVYILKEKEKEDDAAGTEKEAIYNADTHVRLSFDGVPTTDGQTISSPMPLMKDIVTIVGYEGENRIWDAEDKIFMDVDSTTQGSGSCYVFYAEDPAQQENSLRLLSNLRVAFVDDNENSPTRGKLVAIAHLDTENPYEENGKVTIPLVLEDDGSTYLTKMEDGNLAVTRLETNTPTKLLTLIYLDGRDISNAEVLAANEIHGQLNIQFGSTVDLTPIDDEELEAAKRTISAVAKKSKDTEYGSNENAITFDYETATSPMSVDVKVKIEGDSPANVSAFFMRQVNATQGSREESFVLLRSDTEEGVYTGTYTFTAPGNYILRTVMLDGVDYSLPADSDATTNKEYPRVEISGFRIDNVTMSYDGSIVTEQTKTVMVSGKSVSSDVSLKFSSGQNKLPGSVRLQFQKDDGTLTSAIMAYNTTDSTWYGTANFSSSGLYTLKYVIMDGEYTELDPKYQKSLDITMGLTVRVADEAGSPRDKLWDGNPYSIPMYVEIYDETGEEVPYLSGVKLRYGVGTSTVDDMDPDVTWDATEGCYTGNILIAGPGVYNFISVDVSGNNLVNTTNIPPEFTCTSPNPPVYYDADPVTLTTPMADMDYILDDGLGNLKVGVRLEEASSARVTAVFYNAENNTEYRSAQVTTIGTTTIDGKPVSEFIFTIPQTGQTPGQTGDWTIRRLELINVYANDKMYREGDPFIMNLTHNEETNDLHVQVVGLKVSVAKVETVAYTGAFMESKNTGPVTITVTDHQGAKLNVPVSDITLQYQLQLNSWKEYAADKNYGGGYDAAHLADQNGAGETDTYTIKCGSDGKTYTLDSAKLTYAGIYEPYTMTFTVNGEAVPYTMAQLKDMGMPMFTLKTTKPTVSITSISPTGTFDADTTGIGSGHASVTVPAFSATNATVYFKCSRSGSGSTCDPYRHNYGRPSVTITLENMGSGTKAELSFGTNIHLYNGTTEVTNYEWTANGACARNVGYYRSRTAANDDKTPAGTITASTLTVTYNNQQYSFTVPTITINNPY